MKSRPRQEIKQSIGLLDECRLSFKDVIDPANAAEMARLLALDDLIIDHFGLFPSQIDSAQLHDILAVACGPGA
jgi:hypothetical protein